MTRFIKCVEFFYAYFIMHLSLFHHINSIEINLKFSSKFTKSSSLVNYWSFNSHIQDLIGNAHLFKGSKASLTSDRFGRPLSALNLSTGFYELPSINYFSSGQFTVTMWVNLKSNNLWSRLIEFCNNPGIDSISIIEFAADYSKTEISLFNYNTAITSYRKNPKYDSFDFEFMDSFGH